MTGFDILKKSKINAYIMLAANVLSLLNVVFIRTSIDYEIGLPRLGQLLSFTMIPTCALIPIMSTQVLKKRLVFVLFTLGNVYFHLSISYESVFIIFLSYQMISWLLIESFNYCGEFNIDMAMSKKRTFTFIAEDHHDDFNISIENFSWSNVFRVYLLIFHLLIAFFGTGNMASINRYKYNPLY